MHYGDLPIRDYASLAMLMEDGIVATGVTEETQTTMYRYRLTSERGFSADDLIDYLSPKSKCFAMYKPFMHPLSRLEDFGSVTLGTETFVYEFDFLEWQNHLSALGCVQLPVEEKILKHPIRPDEVSASNKTACNQSGISSKLKDAASNN